jgi:aldehyde dehydrogenase (NAD+)
MINEIFLSQKDYFQKELQSRTIQSRLAKLKKLQNWIRHNEQFICDEIYKDFEKGREEVLLTEIKPILDEIKQHRIHLSDWAESKKVSTSLSFWGTNSHIQYEPKGVTLIIAPWNYPFNLCIGPLISAIGAGCTAIIKPSEHTPNTSNLIEKMISELFSSQEVKVILGDVSVSTELLNLPFDHIFFTGSPSVGKIVMTAAAKNLTSVTLELGGRNPTIVDETANIKDAAQKIVWGKFINSGQTCIAPNYILVHEKQAEALKKALIEQITIQFPITDESRTKIVNPIHYKRLVDLLEVTKKEEGEILVGGVVNPDKNFISPTLVSNLTSKSSIFKEEIFGPILPIISFSTLTDAMEVVQETEKPLALYLFSKNRKNKQFVLQNTSAGTTAINETTIQFAQPHLPFGGVNHSGIGKAHGEFGFLEFSNQRAVLSQRIGFTTLKTILPPYSKFKRKLIRFITFWA